MEIKLVWLEDGNVNINVDPSITFPQAFGMLYSALEKIRTNFEMLTVAQAQQMKQQQKQIDEANAQTEQKLKQPSLLKQVKKSDKPRKSRVN